MPAPPTTVTQLSETFLVEMAKALSLPPVGVVLGMMRTFFNRPARRFSELILGLDREIGLYGPAAGARWVLPHFVAGYSARGAELIPKEGPLVIASNHPASYDGMVISAFVERRDYKIIIFEIPSYQHVPNIRQHAIFSPADEDKMGRMATVRKAIRHLRAGGALLIFPRGGIEADPDWMPNPDEEFHRWSRSLDIFLRGAPGTQVLVTIASGVISQRAWHHPLTWFRKKRNERQRLAFMLQMMSQVLTGRELYGLRPRVTFGEILKGVDPANLHIEVEAAAQRTLGQHMAWGGA